MQAISSSDKRRDTSYLCLFVCRLDYTREIIKKDLNESFSRLMRGKYRLGLGPTSVKNLLLLQQ